ncbi:MAG: Gfo/Idh/MocA family oxidoreductase [Gemmataceae bacterium]|nr:Gfo/Idh/MocA family oxidoreductase [Gemmataceae bacterium]
MKKYRVAVIGRTGKGNYGHALDTAWLKCDRAEIVAVADEDEQGRAAAAQRLRVRNAYADYRQMLEKERPDIVSVAPRWPDCHRDMVIACARFGAHVFLEKPVAQDLQQADEMVAACDQHHVHVAVAHQTAYSPKLQVIQDLIRSGQLGDILYLRSHGREDHRGGGEDLMVLGTHACDLMRHLAGEARWAFAYIQQKGRKALPADVRQGTEPVGPIVGDQITATFGFSAPTVGQFYTHVAQHGVGSRYWMEIRGSKGTIHMGYGIMPFAYFCDDPSGIFGHPKAKWTPISTNGIGRPETFPTKDLENGNILIIQDLIAAIEQDRPPKDSLRDGRAALEMIMAVYESHRRQQLVELPLKNRKHPLQNWK